MQISATDSDSTTKAASPMDLGHVVSTVKDFLRDMEYITPDIDPFNEELEASMLAELEARNLHVDRLKQTVNLCASLIELGYHDLEPDEKQNVATLNWYLVYIDDMLAKNPAPFLEFEQRFLCGQPQLDPILDALVDVLLQIFNKYQQVSANSIIMSVLAFITSSCIESELETRPLVQCAQRFPWHLRERTGVSEAFAFFIFTNSRKIDVMQCVQAIPDMIFWIDATNDLLSYYKEELNGDKANYVNTRAFVEKKNPQVVLTEIKDELLLSRNVILTALADCPDALNAWKVWERGYVKWHMVQSRYKLQDLAL